MTEHAIDPSRLPYRKGVGAVLLNGRGEVFVGRRIDSTQEAWQMPQGGLDEGEDIRACLMRELKEEIGTDRAEILAETRSWLTYDLPPYLVPEVWGGKYRGQKQKWFALRFLGQDSDIRLDTHHPEFLAWTWMRPEEVLKVIVPFKRQLYVDVFEEFRHLLAPSAA